MFLHGRERSSYCHSYIFWLILGYPTVPSSQFNTQNYAVVYPFRTTVRLYLVSGLVFVWATGKCRELKQMDEETLRFWILALVCIAFYSTKRTKVR